VALERRDPLPPGRYWIYVLEDELEDWSEWSRAHAATVHVVASEQKTKLAPFTPAVFATRWDGSIIMDGAGAWFLFDVSAPTPWVGFGFPTIVTDMTIRRSTDVEAAPEPEPDGQLGSDLWGEIKGLVFFGGAIALVAAFIGRPKR